MVRIFEVPTTGVCARFSDLAAAQSYAEGKTLDGHPARVIERSIPDGSEDLWSVDSALPSRSAAAPRTEPKPETKAETKAAPPPERDERRRFTRGRKGNVQ